MDAAAWDARYGSADRIWSGAPNAQLVAEITGLAPGRALEVGCGEGADAIWLASAGWDVVAVDISRVALERAAAHAGDGLRIEWRQADLLAEAPEPAAFDLVSCHFMQLPPGPRTRMLSALVRAVRPGGTLLVVGHDPSDHGTGVGRPPMAELFYTGDDVAAMLDRSWEVIVNEARPRAATKPDGAEATVHDAVLRAVRH